MSLGSDNLLKLTKAGIDAANAEQAVVSVDLMQALREFLNGEEADFQKLADAMQSLNLNNDATEEEVKAYALAAPKILATIARIARLFIKV